eukprot:CAMPEP_0119270344 /NCGR_PEP_ID=MMETSP1329-20130426/7386_1 /TAXON_ID=114041 /ORGANISM="Genus nov. species nov., Strain RCC1024" /LENGTH=71 /DNA_ID=CAMNT_0007270363 /DNA_START=65 /DNA_END=277 /DNA_ORIENTATION=+
MAERIIFAYLLALGASRVAGAVGVPTDVTRLAIPGEATAKEAQQQRELQEDVETTYEPTTVTYAPTTVTYE